MADNFFARAAELSARGEPFVTATVVRAERPTSAKPGDRAIVTAGGERLPEHRRRAGKQPATGMQDGT